MEPQVPNTNEPQTPPQVVLPTAPTPVAQPSPNTRPKILILVCIIAALVIAAAVALFVLRPKSAKTPTSSNTTNSSTTSGPLDISSLDKAYDSFYASGVKEFEPSKKQATLDALKQLLDGFELNKDYFAKQSNVLVALGVGRLAADDTAHLKNYRNELYVSALIYLTKLPAGITDEYFTQTLSDADTIKTFNKFTDTNLTEQMRKLLDSSGVKSDVAKNLKLSGPDKLAPYTAIVMNFEAVSDGQKEFAKEMYIYGATPQMWVMEVGGHEYILITKDYAQSFLSNPNGSVRSSVEHEFIHAQNPFDLGELGRAVEERRAEYFSGDHSAYYDAKQLFIYTEVFSGISPLSLFDQHATDPAQFYLNLYAKLGLKTANKFVASWPSPYLAAASTVVKSAAELGGMNPVIDDAIVMGAKDQAGMDARMKARYEKLLTVFKTKDRVLADLQNNLSELYKMPSAAKKMTDYIKAHY